MDPLSFIASLVDSLAWPAAILAAIAVLREPIGKTIQLLRKLRYRELELSFDHRIEEIESAVEKAHLPEKTEKLPLPESTTADDLLNHLVAISPSLAIVEAMRYIEESAKEAGEKNALPSSMDTPLVIGRLEERGILQAGVRDLYYDLRRLRNDAAQSTSTVPEQVAHRFVGQALRLAAAIRNS